MTYQTRMSAGWQQKVGLYDEQDNTWWTATGWGRNSAEHPIKRVAFKSWAVAGCQQSCKSKLTIRPRLFWVKPKKNAREKLEAGLTRVLVRHYGWESVHVSKAVQEIMERLP